MSSPLQDLTELLARPARRELLGQRGSAQLVLPDRLAVLAVWALLARLVLREEPALRVLWGRQVRRVVLGQPVLSARPERPGRPGVRELPVLQAAKQTISYPWSRTLSQSRSRAGQPTATTQSSAQDD